MSEERKKYEQGTVVNGCPDYENCVSQFKNETNCKGNLHYFLKSICQNPPRNKPSKLENE